MSQFGSCKSFFAIAHEKSKRALELFFCIKTTAGAHSSAKQQGDNSHYGVNRHLKYWKKKDAVACCDII